MSKLKPKKSAKNKFGSLRDSIHSIRTALAESSVTSNTGNANAVPSK